MLSTLQLTLICLAICFAILSQGPPMFLEAAVLAGVYPVFVVEVAALTLELGLTNQAMISTETIRRTSQGLKWMSLDWFDICHFENQDALWFLRSTRLLESAITLSRICREPPISSEETAGLTT